MREDAILTNHTLIKTAPDAILTNHTLIKTAPEGCLSITRIPCRLPTLPVQGDDISVSGQQESLISPTQHPKTAFSIRFFVCASHAFHIFARELGGSKTDDGLAGSNNVDHLGVLQESG